MKKLTFEEYKMLENINSNKMDLMIRTLKFQFKENLEEFERKDQKLYREFEMEIINYINSHQYNNPQWAELKFKIVS